MSDLVTPQERTAGFLSGTYKLTDNITFYGQFIHNKTKSSNMLAPAVFGTPTVPGELVSNESYYNPFGTGPNGHGSEPVSFSNGGNILMLRLVPAGNRSNNVGNTTDWVNFGVRGDATIADQDWTWDVGYTYSHFSLVNSWHGLPDQSKLLPGLGPSFVESNGQVVCGVPGSVVPDCTPWDPFNLNSPSAQAVLPGAAAPSVSDAWDIERVYHADISGGLVNLPAGTAQLAAGVSYRKEYTNNVVDSMLVLDPTSGTCTLGSQCSAHLQGGFNVKEVYGELFIPVLKDLPGIHQLNLTLGDRYSKYSTIGSTSNWKIALEYRPIPDLLLRGTVSKVFRAPTISDTFGAPISDSPLLTAGPCNFRAPTPAAPNPNAGNPACAGVPATGTFINQDVAANQQIHAIQSGSQFAGFPLGPEIDKSFDFGAVYSPHFVPRLTVTADIWRVYLNNVITQVGAQTVLDLCFNGQQAYCPLISRNQEGGAVGQIRQITDPTANLGRLDVKGVDASADYVLPAFSFGQFDVRVNATYMSKFTINTSPGQAANQTINGAGVMGNTGSLLETSCPMAESAHICFFPRIKAQGTLGWKLGLWNAQWTIQYTSPFKMADQIADGAQGIDRYGSYVYNNVTAGYNIEPLATRVDVGVDNVFDKQPPMLYANRSQNSNTDPSDFDVIGRYYWVRATVSF